MKHLCKILTSIAILLSASPIYAEMAMQNIGGRESITLNGRWAVLPDVMDMGIKGNWGAPQKQPTNRLNEVYFEGGTTLNVPGDWNSQYPEYTYFEDRMWYKRTFDYTTESDRRYFLHFGAANAQAIVFFNGIKVGEHQGGFTPFQFEVTDLIKDGENVVIVRVDNIRNSNIIPAHDFDWWNYGGLTRDVDLISTPSTFIEDYWLRLEKGSLNRVLVDITLNGEKKSNQKVTLTIGGTKIEKVIKTDEKGCGSLAFDAELELWSPDSPKLYDVELMCDLDSIKDQIGFRSFEAQGTEIMLNGEAQFLKGVNIHEEIGTYRRRSVGSEDAKYLVNSALELGCNFVRLTHYPADEHLVRECERAGLMIWEEIPVRGHAIDFTNEKLMAGAEYMMDELMNRDKNRCGVVMWSVANETIPTSENRNEFLKGLIEWCREKDNTRAIVFATNQINYIGDDTTTLTLQDPVADYVDIIGVNKYQGWYVPWRGNPAETEWVIRDNKPIIMSEFGAGVVYGHSGDGTDPQSFSEDYAANAYRNYLSSYENIPNLRGTVPWLLFDFRSLRRSHAKYQQGWNRKGLLSPDGERKQIWYIMRDYYEAR